MLLLPVSATYYKVVSHALLVCTSVGVQYRNGTYLFRDASGPTTKETGCEILLYFVLYSARSWCISQEKQVGYELV